ncbi:MAG: alpha-1,4-glucan--maltose-1-phosphate maltosyltransferase [Gammaproteobacteria bacterium]|nr:alpha-1,4-glucan--maltose-1-phosphate maltosyltransferase [Gammaproteobacteria bacterium]
MSARKTRIKGKEVDGQKRVALEAVKPEIDAGRFPIKRTVGEKIVVEADAFTDGHDQITCVLLHRREAEADWIETPMTALGNDRWRATFTVTELGHYYYTLAAWVDHFQTWRHELAKRPETDKDLPVAFLIGSNLIAEAARRAKGESAARLKAASEALASDSEQRQKRLIALEEELAVLMARYAERKHVCRYEKELTVVVDLERARFSSWYEFFPRSCTNDASRHGTFKDCEARLQYVAEMGFDIVYLPPIHPVGRTNRKGKNNALECTADDVGSPWAIGADEGGHSAVHPELGTLEDFRQFVSRANALEIEIALDIAYQCTPDHPYVKEHPEWFRQRPDGTIQYAENPPKKYQDIYPIYFESEDWQGLWEELKDVVLFWIGHGVKIFRVDNPHTKALPFWEWMIGEIKREYPDVIFLSEAFTRPRMMYRLAKLGFTQSYTYFTWRNTNWELAQYFTELTQTEVREYLRPNLWPNTPDILHAYLQFGGRPAFMTRFILAATLGASYGMYGPAFELCENRAREPGSEEYLDSEKYQIRVWDLDRSDSLRDLIARVNRIRRENPALHSDWSLRFHPVDNEQLICYSKSTEDLNNIIVAVVNLDPHHTQSGSVELPMDTFGLDPQQPYQVHDLISDARYMWNGARNYVELNPDVMPAHIFRLRRRIRTEQDFDYFL